MTFFLFYDGNKIEFPSKKAAQDYEKHLGLKAPKSIIVEAENAYRCENGLCERTQGEFAAMRSIEAHGMVLCGKCCRELFPLPVEDDVVLSPCIL